ncbi:Eaa1 [Klebsiella pneumoniae]|uniref:Eaa1 n=1 Tax=Klebsiella pneumoniae TaxID=573 RepID=A0A378BY28_KLEPN|nr:Eaa1 [Klebsiella pneumoniae]STU29589.1 Eaa1 [Klebsiella pneumoniae]STU52793.1 Eaa1 [Klebsiella pneumoniae]STV56348.1 Eaa1 [Klebsiella pneumoniae]
MSEFSRETLLNIIETDHVQCGEASALARIALAALDSEPVAWMHNNNNIGIPAITTSQKIGQYWMSEFKDVQPLYRHAQPAPVVMDDTKLRELFDSWFASDCSFDLSPEASEADNIAWRESYWYVWKRCRAAMLAAAPHDTPALNSVQSVATVPGKWIPVSERMPEDEQEVLTINKIGHRFVSFFDKHSGLFFDRLDAPAACCIEHVLVTHWMPLPNPPKE